MAIFTIFAVMARLDLAIIMVFMGVFLKHRKNADHWSKRFLKFLGQLVLWSTNVLKTGLYLKVLIYTTLIIRNAPHNQFLLMGSL